ncbi:UNVERIFIED_CONTAM: NHL repeat-containing protein [Acetivibrio alkalicellulosi]
MKRPVALLVGFIIFIFSFSSFGANVPYESYTYDFRFNVVPSPAPYVPIKSVDGNSLGVGSFQRPEDMHVTEDGEIFILDTGNNRIVVFDNKWNHVETISKFINDGEEDTFNNPHGIYVTKKGDIYIADTDNRRIVALTRKGDLIKVIADPKSELFPENFIFAPLKVCVDYADRVFVIARNVLQGIMNFDEEGDFFGYVGTIKVNVSLTDIIWRSLSTKEQRQRQQLFVPTEFTNMDIDSGGFIYTTNIDNFSNETVKRLNPSGEDVLRRPVNAPVRGDHYYTHIGRYGGPSRFVDIIVRDNRMYSVLDSRRGRIFTYDHQGNLLYIFGGVGTQTGTFRRPVAIDELDENLIVLDRDLGEVIIFETTNYGSYINTAIALQHEGRDEETAKFWSKVLKLNANFELAYVGVGKALLADGNNKEAMKYFKIGMDQKYYSIAFKRYRNEVLKANLGYVLTALMVLLICFIVFKIFKNKIVLRRKCENA